MLLSWRHPRRLKIFLETAVSSRIQHINQLPAVYNSNNTSCAAEVLRTIRVGVNSLISRPSTFHALDTRHDVSLLSRQSVERSLDRGSGREVWFKAVGVVARIICRNAPHFADVKRYCCTAVQEQWEMNSSSSAQLQHWTKRTLLAARVAEGIIRVEVYFWYRYEYNKQSTAAPQAQYTPYVSLPLQQSTAAPQAQQNSRTNSDSRMQTSRPPNKYHTNKEGSRR